VLAEALIKSVNFAGVGCAIESDGATIIAGGEERLVAALSAVLCSGERRNSCDFYFTLRRKRLIGIFGSAIYKGRLTSEGLYR